MLILVINCGSSSAKYQLFDIDRFKEKNLAKGVVERIGERGSDCRNYYQAMSIIRDILLAHSEHRAIISSIRDIRGIGHRVVHGGERFSKSVIIKKDVIEAIDRFKFLAPLHNPPSLAAIKACKKLFSKIPQVAVFDTAFHQSMPPRAYIYGIPYKFYKKYGIRRYGFHGTSHRFVAYEVARILKRPLNELKVITVHLGNGCSICCIKKGRSIDTTMGFTPLEGLLMGTRAGDMDPAIVTFLMQKEGLKSEEIDGVLNKKSGLLGVSGVSNDMRDILRAIKKGSKRASLAFDIFLYRIKKYIGSYAAVMGGVDAVAFTGGIGENVPQIRTKLLKELRPIFCRRTRFLVVHTNEELLIARDTYKLVKSL